jgi:hypothetical protein
MCSVPRWGGSGCADLEKFSLVEAKSQEWLEIRLSVHI